MYENSTEEILQAQNKEQGAMERLIEKNSGLIWSIVKRFSGRGYELEELYQIGAIGFMKAIARFDTTFEVKLSTYAVPYMIGEIKRFLRDDGPIKVSRNIKELAGKIKEIQREYLERNGQEITIQKMAELLKTSKEEIAVALEYTKPLESIYDYAYDDEDTYKIEKINVGQDEASKIVDKLTIKQLIENLETKEKELVLLRYFKDKTQCQVAKILGISQVQVSRMEKKILNNMKTKLVC